MVRRTIAKMVMLSFVLFLLPISALANTPAVNDAGKLLSEAELSKITETVNAFNDKHTAYVAVVSAADLSSSKASNYIDKYYDKEVEANHPDALVVLLFKEDEEVHSWLAVYGGLDSYLTQGQFDAIIDESNEAFDSDAEAPLALYCAAITDGLAVRIQDSQFVKRSPEEAAAAAEKAQQGNDTPIDKNRVFDDAGLLAPDVINKINSLASTQAKKYGIDVGVYTFTDLEGDHDVRTHADRFILSHDFGVGIDKDAVLYYIYMNGDDREFGISTSGLGIDYFTDKRIDTILDETIGYLKNRDFNRACDQFMTMADEYLEDGIPKGAFRQEEKGLNPLDAALGLLPAGLGAFFTRRRVKKTYSGKDAPDPYNIMKNFTNTYYVNDRRHLRTDVRYEKIKDDSNKSTTHSTDGHTFGGSSRKF